MATWCERIDSLKKTLILGNTDPGEGDDRGWDGWMASPTWWTWVWANSGSWWWTGKPGVLHSMGSQRVGQDWATELNWTEVLYVCYYIFLKFSHLYLVWFDPVIFYIYSKMVLLVDRHACPLLDEMSLLFAFLRMPCSYHFPTVLYN